MENKIWGYYRENGIVGIRNYIVIMPVDDISNAAAEAVAKILRIPHAYQRFPRRNKWMNLPYSRR